MFYVDEDLQSVSCFSDKKGIFMCLRAGKHTNDGSHA